MLFQYPEMVHNYFYLLFGTKRMAILTVTMVKGYQKSRSSNNMHLSLTNFPKKPTN